MTTSDKHHIPPDAMPAPQGGRPASRRLFLKTIGATVVSAVAASAPIHAHTLNALESAMDLPISSIDAALAIAQTSPMFQEALAELQVSGFGFDVTPSSVRRSAVQGDLIGLVVQQRHSANPRVGANLILTINLSTKVLVLVQIVVGWCLVDSLKVVSTMFDVRQLPFEELRSARVRYEQPSRLIQPRLEQQWSYARPNPRSLEAEELVEFGWPPESSATCYWHYSGCHTAAWVTDQNILLFRCTQVVETQSCQPTQQQIYDLQYRVP